MADYTLQLPGADIDARLAKVPQLESALAGKQDTLVGSGTGQNVKTINGQSIVGQGDIVAGDPNAVKYVSQTLTEEQKAQARGNINAASASDLASAIADISGMEVDIASLEAAVEAINTGDYVTATTLPTASASTMGHIYLIGPDANNNYDRYFTQQSGSTYSWVSLGSTQIDLSTYATQAELNQLEHEVTNELYEASSVETPASYSVGEAGKSIEASGNTKANANYAISTPIALNEGDTLVCAMANVQSVAIALYDNGTYIPKVNGGTGSGIKTFSYVATEDCQVVISWRSATADPEYVKIVSTVYSSRLDAFEEQLPVMQQDISELEDEVDKIMNGGVTPITPISSGFSTCGIINSGTDVVIRPGLNANNCIAFFSVETGKLYHIYVNGTRGNRAWGWCDSILNAVPEEDTNLGGLVSTDSTSIGNTYDKIVQNNGGYDYIVIAYTKNQAVPTLERIEDTDLVSYKPQSKSASEKSVARNNIGAVGQEELDVVEDDVAEISDFINGGTREVDTTYTSGYIVHGTVNSSENYEYSAPIFLQKGHTIKVSSTGNGFSAISFTNSEGDQYSDIAYIGNTVRDEVKVSTYTADADCYVAACVRITMTHSVEMISPSLIELVETFNEDSEKVINATGNVGNITIVAAKEHHFTDGTPPVIEWYLLSEPSTHKLYWSKDLTKKKYLFTFPASQNYSFGILANGDIIGVIQADALPETSSDDNRVNPYYIKASEDWSIVHELDFGSSLKPCGWLENCGFLALENGDALFVEYTRISVETCNVWKISGDVEDAGNWSVKKSFTLSGQADAGLKHLHAVQQDFYNGIIYISTGDYEASSIYASLDNGETFTAVLENDERKCRSLEMTFTKDYVCWGSDSTLHVFVRCARLGSGLIDIENADVVQIPRTTGGSLAFYGQALLREINSVLLLDRQDGGGSANSFPLYMVNIGTLEITQVGVIKGVGSETVGVGFRTWYTEWYPINGVIRFGFGFNTKTKNRIAACGNNEVSSVSGTQTINNLILYVSLYAGTPSISFGTIWL